MATKRSEVVICIRSNIQRFITTSTRLVEANRNCTFCLNSLASSQSTMPSSTCFWLFFVLVLRAEAAKRLNVKITGTTVDPNKVITWSLGGYIVQLVVVT